MTSGGRYPDALARSEVARRLARDLHYAVTAESDEHLLAGMNVPDGTAPGGEAHFVDPYGVVAGSNQPGQPDLARVPVRIAGLERTWCGQARWCRRLHRAGHVSCGKAS